MARKSSKALKKLLNQGKGSKKQWSNQEKDFLKKHACDMIDEEIAERLDKTTKAIREMRYRLGLIKESGRGRCELRED